MLYDDLTYQIIGCCMNVHNILGNGFQEVIYQRGLAVELQEAGLSIEREIEQIIFYKGANIGSRRADFVVADKILIEIKAIVTLEDVHLAQAKNYLTAYNLPIGLLINFGSASMQYKKVFRAN